MRPIEITRVLDLAKIARDKGLTFNPLFAGDAGVGKSEICQLWVKEQQKTNPDFEFRDLRIAQLEAPDFVGLVKIVNRGGQDRTDYITPNFWPAPGTSGLLLLEEVNRANSSNMNALMQLLTDRKMHDYKLPEGWIIAAAVNPDDSNYDVNSMDTAFRDRFEIYDVEHDHKGFIQFAKDSKWHSNIINFLESQWVYKRPGEIGDQGTYVSPRTWSKLNNAELCGLQENPDLHYQTAVAKLGKGLGKEYYAFTFDNRPVTLADLIKPKSKAMDKLKKYSDPNNYKGDLISVTLKTIVEGYGTEAKCTDKLICEVAKIIPADQAANLLQEIIHKDFKLNEGDMKKVKTLAHYVKLDPELKDSLKKNLRTKKETDETEKVEEKKAKV